jgi:hydrogenase expression/formation protein HypC
MCLGIPMKVLELGEGGGVVESGGVSRRVRLDLCPEAKVGEWVIVHAGYAIQVLDEEAARETLDLLALAGLAS